MTCVKTGFQGYLDEYDEYVRGDAYLVGGTLILRISSRCIAPPNRVHFRVSRIGEWFDRDQDVRPSVLVVAEGYFVHYGYDGVSPSDMHEVAWR